MTLVGLPDLSRPAIDVAPDLLGLVLRRGDRAGVIVEVEAYDGESDPASHAARGPTVRNASMYGPPGTLYVYLIYGMHWCANIVCSPQGEASAVLVRALMPTAGLVSMRRHRPLVDRDVDLCSGPGKLCAALGISGQDDGSSVLSPGAVRLERHPTNVFLEGKPIVSGPRVGISKATDRPWRFAVAGVAEVSRPRVGLVQR